MNSFAGACALGAVKPFRPFTGTERGSIQFPRSVRVAEAPSFGSPVVFWDPRSTGAVAYKKLALEIAARGVDAAADQPEESTEA